MGISQKMNQLVGNVQDGVKITFKTVFNFLLKLSTGLVLGLTLGLIAQEMIGFGTFALLFSLVVITGVFMKISSKWNIGGVLIFDLICVLVGALLRMYILMAP